jgi:hypothetical protein
MFTTVPQRRDQMLSSVETLPFPRVCLMQQVKLFKSVDNELPEMEHQINRWMRKSGARVLSINGNLTSQSSASNGPLNSFAAGDVLVIVLYEIDKPAR